ncbi:MAG: type VI secretion system ATPase TssH [Desulfovibrio sp.]|jgi:type VI secretion system protein VasG|nr:type VI secretion system ATPase TssH [Desulfovibrio sp.]
MASISLAALFESLDIPCREALEVAAVACAGRGGYEITIDDYVESLLPLEDMQNILTQFERSASRLRELLEKNRPQNGRNAGRPTFSPLLYQFLQEAYLLASLELRQERVNAGVLVLALLQNPVRYSVFPFFKELKEIPADNLRALLEGLQAEKNPAKSVGSGQVVCALQQYATDFTEEAREGKTDPVFARGHELRIMTDILTRRRKNNPILVGDPGVGKTAVVEGLARKVIEGNVPDALKGVRIVGLDMGRLQAGASVKGEFEKRLKSVIDEIKSSPVPTILFIDEAHTLVGSGNQAGGGDGANLLKPALARGEMRTIAATTWSEYKKYFEKDAALARRFQLVKLDEPSLEETVTILRGIVPHYEKNHKVYVRDDAVIRTAELAGRYITGRQLPDKAIDVLDTACARVRVSLGAKPAVLESLEEEWGSVRRELDALERDRCKGVEPAAGEDSTSRHAELQQRAATLTARINEVERQWQREKSLVEAIISLRTNEEFPKTDAPTSTADKRGGIKAGKKGTGAKTSSTFVDTAPEPSLNNLTTELRAIQAGSPLVHYEVSPELVADIVSEWTGIPVSKLSGTGAVSLTNLGESLRRRIRGQDHALTAIERAVTAAHAGLDSPARPTGIFLFVGPSGVGKTETALAVADELYGGERMLVGVNMSEFQEKHTISRLIGSPPGYVGYGEGGRLTEAIRRQPYSAVLFDEVEKAHPDILNLFYQMFDKGILADGEGREVDFRNTIIFMTSNLGGDILTALFEDGKSPTPETALEALRPSLSQFFHPALLARMTVVPFMPINPDILKELVVIKLSQVGERLHLRHRLSLDWSDAVVASITASCTAVDSGARNIDHIINSNLLPGMASILLNSLANTRHAPDSLRIDLNAETGRFAYRLQRRGKPA